MVLGISQHCFSGTAAYFDKNEGSWYIQSLVKVLKKVVQGKKIGTWAFAGGLTEQLTKKYIYARNMSLLFSHFGLF